MSDEESSPSEPDQDQIPGKTVPGMRISIRKEQLAEEIILEMKQKTPKPNKN